MTLIVEFSRTGPVRDVRSTHEYWGLELF